jgi:hypothetical protein
MAKSPSGLELRAGKSIRIGDNRYGMREAYDPAVDAATKKYYREGDTVTVKEVKNTVLGTVRTKKP